MSKRFNIKDQLEKLYIEVPKALLYKAEYKPNKDKGIKGLSNDAKLLYGVLLDRTYLSFHKATTEKDERYIDDKGDIFIYFELAAIEEILNIGTKKAISVRKELINYNLLEEVKVGQGKDIRLYLKTVDVCKDDLKLYTTNFLDIVKNKKKSEEERIAKIREKKKSESIENTLYCQKGSTGTVKKEVQVLPKRQISNTDSSKTDFSKTESLVVVLDNAPEEKDYSPKTSNEFYDIQKDNSINTLLKVNQLSSKTYMTNDTISVLHKFIDANILVSEPQIKMLNGMSRSVIENAIETTVAQNGKSFSYFLKVYKSKEQEEINDMMDDFIFKPSFSPSI